jgi:hypothetical protein
MPITKEEPMTNRTNTSSQLDSTRVPVQTKLAAAWTSFMFLYVYVDVLGFYKPGVVDGILNGRVFTFEVSAPLLTFFLVSVSIPGVMVVLSVALPARVNRVTNLVVAALYIPYCIVNAVGETWEWAGFYGISIGVEVVILAFILRSAWAWPRTAVIAVDAAKSHAPAVSV